MPLLAVRLYLLVLRAQFYVQQALSPLKPVWDYVQYVACCRRVGGYGLMPLEHPDDPEHVLEVHTSLVGEGRPVTVMRYHDNDPSRQCKRVLYCEAPEPLPRCAGRDVQSLPFYECEVEYVDGAIESVYESLLEFRVRGNVIRPDLIRVLAKRPGVGIHAIHLQSLNFETGDLVTTPLGPDGVRL